MAADDVAAGAEIVAAAAVIGLWHDRVALDGITWAPYPFIEPRIDAVTMTWLGTTTMLFDDGETQVLIDGFISRPTIFDVVLRRPVSSDAATINYVMDEYRMRRLAAIINHQGPPIPARVLSKDDRHRVVAGPFDDKGAAKDAAKRLKIDLELDGVLFET